MEKTASRVILILVGLLLFFGGLGLRKSLVEIVGVAVGVLLLFLILAAKRKIAFPSGFFVFLAFLLILLSNIILRHQWGKSGEEYLLLFSSGGLFWLIFYNFREELRRVFGNLVLVIGFAFLLTFISGFILNRGLGNIFSLAFPVSRGYIHHHIGDWWAVVLSIVSYRLLIKGDRIKYWAIAAVGVSTLIFSQSRSAYLAFLTGLAFIYLKKEKIKFRLPKIPTIVFILLAALFVYAGLNKPTLSSRVYFIQSLVGFFENPFGVGIGNFGSISIGLSRGWGEGLFYSGYTHSLPLEVLVGLGIFGIPFFIWLYLLGKNLWEANNDRAIIYQVVSIVLFTNFFFDVTYLIPAMFWLWFASLGLAYGAKERGFRANAIIPTK